MSLYPPSPNPPRVYVTHTPRTSCSRQHIWPNFGSFPSTQYPVGRRVCVYSTESLPITWLISVPEFYLGTFGFVTVLLLDIFLRLSLVFLFTLISIFSDYRIFDSSFLRLSSCTGCYHLWCYSRLFYFCLYTKEIKYYSPSNKLNSFLYMSPNSFDLDRPSTSSSIFHSLTVSVPHTSIPFQWPRPVPSPLLITLPWHLHYTLSYLRFLYYLSNKNLLLIQLSGVSI